MTTIASTKSTLLIDDEPGQKAFYESLGYQEMSEYRDASLRAYIRFD